MNANRRQFLLWQIMMVTGLMGVIFALAGPGKLPLSQTLLLVASFGIALGLWQQASDIARAITAADATTDLRILRIWRFEMIWRRLFAAAFFLGSMLAALIAQGVFGFVKDDEAEFRASPTTYADGLLLLVIVVGLASSVTRWRGTPRKWYSAWVHRAGWIAGIALLVVVTVRETALIDGLVHIAIRSIELAQPEPYGETFYSGGVWRYESQVAQFAWLQLVLVGLVLINAAMLIRMTDRRAKRWSRVGYVLSIVLALGVALWNRWIGFASISPVLAGAHTHWIAHVWCPAIPLIFLFGFAATYRLLAHSSQPLDEGPSWRPQGRIYVSESSWVIIVAVIGSV